MPTTLKTILLRTTVTLLIIVLILFINEILFCLVMGPPNPDADIIQNNGALLFTPNAQLRVKTAEFDYTASINNFGYRGRNFSMIKKSDQLRILAVGDSVVFGAGASEQETIPALLESDLKNQNINAEVINAGIEPSSPIYHYVNLRDIHLQYKPDIVLLFVNLDDIHDDWLFEQQAVYRADGEIAKIDQTFVNGKRSWWKTLLKYSSSFLAFDRRIMQPYRDTRVLGKENYQKYKDSNISLPAFVANYENQLADDTIIAYDPLLMLRGIKREQLIRQQFKRTEKYLNKIKTMLDAHNIPLILVVNPYGIHVGKDQWTNGRKEWGFTQDRASTDYLPFTIIGEYTSRNRIPFINTLPSFLRAEKNKYFYDDDVYMTPAGNQLIADAISNKVLFRKIVDQTFKKMKK